jgi:hypothetical protein
MISLRNLLTPRMPMRSFALLDSQGICRALHQSAQSPQGFGWIEVEHTCPAWLNRPLPANVKTLQVTPCLLAS